MRILGIPVRISPLLPLLLLIGMVLGLGAELGIALSSLILHECAHAYCARALGVSVQEIELMPLGGAARMRDIGSLRTAQVVRIALSGPLVNLLIIMMASACAYLGMLGVYTATLWMRANIAMLLFNMLPALPLDGGRVGCAWLGHWLGARRALRIFVISGVALGIVMLGGAAAMLMLYGQMNVTMLCAGGFLIASARREQQLGEGATLVSLLDKQAALVDEGALPIRFLAAQASLSPARLLTLFRPRMLHRIAVYGEQMEFLGILEERALLDGTDAQTIGEMMGSKDK